MNTKYPQDIIDEVDSQYPNLPDIERKALLDMKLNTRNQINNGNKPEESQFKSVYHPDTLNKENKVVVESIIESKGSDLTYIEEISQPDMSQPFDLIPLPSRGSTYPGKRDKIKVAYINASDESVMTSPNLIQSGEFLEVLFNRKILDQTIRYKDLLPGDRNAIMVWLRATAYGEMYDILVDGGDEGEFEHTVDLSTLKNIYLDADSDINGYFDFEFPLSKDKIKFKLLTIGDIDEISDLVDKDSKNGVILNNELLYTLEREIVSVNGDDNSVVIKSFIKNIRSLDVKSFRAHVFSLDSGIDLNIDIKTPGGGSIKTFLPFASNFFWVNS